MHNPYLDVAVSQSQPDSGGALGRDADSLLVEGQRSSVVLKLKTL